MQIYCKVSILNESRICIPIKQNDYGGWKTLLKNNHNFSTFTSLLFDDHHCRSAASSRCMLADPWPLKNSEKGGANHAILVKHHTETCPHIP